MSWKFDVNSPISTQIVKKLRIDIVNGIYEKDSQFPSVRQLAVEANVNPNTMQKSLAILESEGLLYTNGTIGRFVTSNEELISKTRQNIKEEFVSNFLLELAQVGISKDELIEYLERGDKNE